MPEFDVAAVQLPSGTWTSPPAKAQQRFVNDKEDDLVFYYQALKSETSDPLVTFPHAGARDPWCSTANCGPNRRY